MTREDLQGQWQKERCDIDYVKWLENKMIEKESMTHDAVLGEVPNITDEHIQELREIILDSGSSRNYQNKQIREWVVRHLGLVVVNFSNKTLTVKYNAR